jgi:cysteine desulfurase
MAVNNETGVIQPVKQIGALCRSRGVLFHTDAAQAAGKIEIDVDEMSIDLLSCTAHKMYGPKGIGALYVRRRPRARIAPLFSGGGQERGFRSGTLPVPLCAGFGAACAILEQEMDAENAKLRALRDRLLEILSAELGDVSINGSMEHRFDGNLNIVIPGADGGDLLASLDDVAISTGSACTSASQVPSYVLTSMGLSPEEASQSFRLSVGRFTTETDIDYAARRLCQAAAELRGPVPVHATGD